MSILDSLPHEATAKRRIRTKGELGGSKDSWITLFTDRPCWQQNATDAQIREFKRDGISVMNRIYFVSDPELTEEDVLTIGGNTFKVRSKAIRDASSGLGIVWRVMVEIRTTERL